MRRLTSTVILAGSAVLCSVILVCIDAKLHLLGTYPDHYDEANYINQVCADYSILKKEGLIEFASHFISPGALQPPGFRLAGFFAALAGEPTMPILRSLSLLSLFVTALLLFLSGKEISGTKAGIVWASAFSFSMGVFAAAFWFGTEATFLFPALAGSIYGLGRWFHKIRPDAVTVIALAVSAALGSFSKVTFFAIFLPLIGAAILLAPETDKRRQTLLTVFGAIAVGTIVAAPWWLVNWRGALWFAKMSSRWSIREGPWVIDVAKNLLGVPFAIGFLIFLCWILARGHRLRKTVNRNTVNFVLVCLAGCLPFAALQMVSANHLTRLLTPALVPGAGVVAVLLDLGGLLKRRAVSTFIALLLLIQTGFIIWQIPWTSEAWDWGQLRELARAHGMQNPAILMVGTTWTFNPPQIEYPWACHGEAIPEPRLAWSPGGFGGVENPPIDWVKLNSLLDKVDIVLTAPMSLFDSSLVGQYNDELARRLHERSDVWTPLYLNFGVGGKTTITVFFRNLKPNFRSLDLNSVGNQRLASHLGF